MSNLYSDFILDREICNKYSMKRILYLILCIVLIITPVGLYYTIRAIFSQQQLHTETLSDLSSYITNKNKDNYYSFSNDNIEFGYNNTEIVMGLLIINQSYIPSNIDMIRLISSELKLLCNMNINESLINNISVIEIELWELLNFNKKMSWNDLITNKLGILVDTFKHELIPPYDPSVLVTFNNSKLINSITNNIYSYILKIKPINQLNDEIIYFTSNNTVSNITFFYNYVPKYLNYIIYGISGAIITVSVVFGMKSYINNKKFKESNCKIK